MQTKESDSICLCVLAAFTTKKTLGRSERAEEALVLVQCVMQHAMPSRPQPVPEHAIQDAQLQLHRALLSRLANPDSLGAGPQSPSHQEASVNDREGNAQPAAASPATCASPTCSDFEFCVILDQVRTGGVTTCTTPQPCCQINSFALGQSVF